MGTTRGLILLLIAFLLTSSLVKTAAASDLPYSGTFKKSWQSDYHPLTCSDNILRFYSRLNNAPGFKVVHIFHKQIPYTSIKPLLNRESLKSESTSSRWLFHAFLLLNNSLVYDLDFKNEPTITSLPNYLKTMWNQNDLEEHYMFQVKSVNTYTEYDTDGFMNDEDVLDLKTFLKSARQQ